MGRPPTNTKDKLIETAIDLIWREGYNAISVDEICHQAGVQKGSFYHYFPSKAHLALATMDSCMEDMKEEYDNIFSTDRPPLERFSLMVQHIIDQQRGISQELGHVCGCPFATLGSELAAQDAEIGNKINDICAKKSRYYENALSDMAKQGIVPKNTDVKLKANEIFAFIIGQLLMARIKNDLGYIEKNLERGLFDLIGVEPASKKLKRTA